MKVNVKNLLRYETDEGSILVLRVNVYVDLGASFCGCVTFSMTKSSRLRDTDHSKVILLNKL
jgi:hypothetical protein